MSRRQFLAASIAASLAAIALAKAASAAPAPSHPGAEVRDDATNTTHRVLTPPPVDKRDCHRHVMRRS